MNLQSTIFYHEQEIYCSRIDFYINDQIYHCNIIYGKSEEKMDLKIRIWDIDGIDSYVVQVDKKEFQAFRDEISNASLKAY